MYQLDFKKALDNMYHLKLLETFKTPKNGKLKPVPSILLMYGGRWRSSTAT